MVGGDQALHGGEEGEEAMAEPTPEGESLSDTVKDVSMPLNLGVSLVVRVPLTYPRLTPAELSGTRYPDVDLSAFSDYERMSRLSECLHMRMEEAV